MRLFFYFRKNWKLFLTVFVFVAIVIATVIVLLNYKPLPEGSTKKINRDYELYPGPIKIGGKMPTGPGGSTFGPILEIPSDQKFYVDVIQQDLWCSNESCGLDGAIVQTLGGWIEVESDYQPETKAMFGLDMQENKNIKSVVIIGDENGKIVGIYLNKDYEDVLSILKKNHTDLANFDFLNGIDEFGKLKVGEYSPLKPGDDISYLFSDKARSSVSKIPNEKKFYLYGIQKRKNIVLGVDKIEKVSEEEREKRGGYICFLGGCRYPEPDDPHDFLFAEIDELGGWFLANDNDNIKMVELFGLNPEDVLSGKSSLVVLTDAKGVIVALHPNKTISDTITILSQHPDIVDIKELYHTFIDFITN